MYKVQVKRLTKKHMVKWFLISLLLLCGHLSSADLKFAFDLYTAIDQTDKENLLFSPFSISSAITLAALGSKNQTWNEMSGVLHWKEGQEKLAQSQGELNTLLLQNKEESYTLFLGNALWVQEKYPLLPTYLHTILNHHLGQVETIDFQEAAEATSRINQWVTNQTHGKISHLLEENDLNALTKLVLTNALYLKAAWKYPFEKSYTHKAPFFLNEEQESLVDMMQQSTNLPIFQHPYYTLIQLPYKEGLSLYILLPKEEHSLADLNPFLTNDLLEQKLQSKPVLLTLPRFQLDSRLNLKQVLEQMGMNIPFSNEADFSKINGNLDLALAQVIHQTRISVDEEGTEASAATAAIMNLKSIQSPPIEVTINRPFLFFIAHQATNTLLFMGRVVNPAAHSGR